MINKIKTILSRNRILLFPVILFLLLLLLTCFRINGSSIGNYHNLFFGSTTKDADLVVNNPRPVRSDEWMVFTQLALSQNNNDYPVINKDIANGQDMSILGQVPYKDWSALFHPENWGYFVLPFDNAFALKWWLMAFLLIVSCYYFILKILPGKIWLAVLLSLSIFFSPFIQWWYQFITLAPIYYALFGTIIFMELLKTRPYKHKILLSLLLAYVGFAFILVCYPGFQIPCAAVVLTFLIGYILNLKKKYSVKDILKKLLWPLASVAIVGLLAGVFYLQHANAIYSLTHTLYPGQRTVVGGTINASQALSGHLDINLQDSIKSADQNQSELSSFPLSMLFLIIPGVLLLIQEYRSKKKIDWPYLLMMILFVTILVRLLTPFLDPVYSLLHINTVPLARWYIALGMVNLMFIVLFIKKSIRYNFSAGSKWLYVYGAACIFYSIVYGLYFHHSLPAYMGSLKAIVLTLVLAVSALLLIKKKFAAGALLLLALGVASTYQVNPLYRGTDILTKTPLSQSIKKIDQKNPGTWIAEGLTIEHFPLLNGAMSLSGTNYYPQPERWKDLQQKDKEYIYNRYAHIAFFFDRDLNQTQKVKLDYQQADYYIVRTEPCDPRWNNNKPIYLIAASPLYDICLTPLDTVKYPMAVFYIYKVNY